MVYFTQLLNRPVMDKGGKAVGKLTDLVFKDGDKFADITHLVISAGGERKKISWEFIREMIDRIATAKTDVEIVLRKKIEDIDVEPVDGSEILVTKLLDRQIVDITGLKIVRANDVVLRKVGSNFSIIGVDVGSGSIIRRLGFDITGKLSLSESFLPWEYVEPIDPEVRSLRVKVDRSKLSKMHPADIADIMEDLNPKQRILIFNDLDEKIAAKTLMETEPSVSKEIINKFNSKKLISLMTKLDADEIAEILGNMPSDKAEVVIRSLSPEVKEMLQKVMSYPENTAGRVMNPNVISVNQDNTVQQVIDYLRKMANKIPYRYSIYVVDREKKLVGIVTLRDLIINPPNNLLSGIVNKRIVKISTLTDKEEASKIIIKYRLSVLPVVDQDGVLRGKITASDILGDTAEKSYLTKPKHAFIHRNNNSENKDNNGRKQRSRKRKKG